MRLLIFAAALTALAVPATAQRLNTTRIDIHPLADGGTTCGFQAYDGLVLADSGKGGGKVAMWAGAPAEDANARMKLAWEPAASNWRTPPFLGVGFTVPADAKLNSDTVVSATLIVDDAKPIPLRFNASRDKLIFGVDRDTDNVGARVIGSDNVVLELLDSAGTALVRYGWNTRRLADAVETVSVVGWSCTTP